jgi:hypothetical protein
MTRSNLYITLSNGKKLQCVAESSSAPEQGYIVEQLLIPLLSFDNAEKELALLQEHCTMDELRTNATYRYLIDLQRKEVLFYEENYFYKTDTFKKGKNITHRYTNYHTESEGYAKEEFKHYSNKALVARVNSLPDFKWDDEGTELKRRWRVSNGTFDYEIRGNTMVILKDNEQN